jgi:hypothetical protein
MEKLDVKSVVELTQLVDETQSHNVMPILGDAVAL